MLSWYQISNANYFDVRKKNYSDVTLNLPTTTMLPMKVFADIHNDITESMFFLSQSSKKKKSMFFL